MKRKGPALLAFVLPSLLSLAIPDDALASRDGSRVSGPAQKGSKGLAQKGKRRGNGKAGGEKKPAPREAAEDARAPAASGDPRAGRTEPLDAVRPPAAEPAGASPRGPSRIEFDERLIQGQTNKANAIYLFERRESALRSLLKKRTDFHEEIDAALE